MEDGHRALGITRNYYKSQGITGNQSELQWSTSHWGTWDCLRRVLREEIQYMVSSLGQKLCGTSFDHSDRLRSSSITLDHSDRGPSQETLGPSRVWVDLFTENSSQTVSGPSVACGPERWARHLPRKFVKNIVLHCDSKCFQVIHSNSQRSRANYL